MLVACQQTIPKEALQLSEDSLALRQLQTRRFDTTDEKKLLSASAGVLQDLGFNVDESETALGVLVGSKNRDATNAGQVAGKIILGLMTGAWVSVDKEQKIRASLITRPTGETSTNLRVTFQRIVWNDKGQISKVESLEQPELYVEFFDKLSKAVFLAANNI